MSKTKKIPALTWQRGYRGHTLWKGDQCIGRIRLGKYGDWDGVYQCEAGTQHNTASSLAEAKRWVGEQARKNLLQMTLF